jgi:hypothetical protein
VHRCTSATGFTGYIVNSAAGRPASQASNPTSFPSLENGRGHTAPARDPAGNAAVMDSRLLPQVDGAATEVEITKPRNDKRGYRRVVLTNALECLLVSDPDTDKV